MILQVRLRLTDFPRILLSKVPLIFAIQISGFKIRVFPFQSKMLSVELIIPDNFS